MFRSKRAGFLQLANCRGDRRATTTQHLGEKFLGEREDVRSSTITAHGEPPGKAFRNLMQAITSSTLGQLHCLGTGIATKHLFEVWRLRQYVLEQPRSNSETAPFALGDRPNRGVAGTKDDWDSDKSFAPGNPYFSRCSIVHHRKEGDHSRSGKVYGCNRLVGLPECFSRFHENKPQILLHVTAFFLGERSQNHVFRVLRVGWIVNVWLLPPRLNVPSLFAPLVVPGHRTFGPRFEFRGSPGLPFSSYLPSLP